MANPVWPVGIPQEILQTSYAESPPDNVVKSQMAVGPPKMRRRSTSGERPFSGVINMTETQLETFDDFFRTTLKDGSLRFDRKHPRDMSGPDVECRFVRPPVYTSAGGSYYNVNVEIEVMP